MSDDLAWRLKNHSKRPPACDCVRCEAADEIVRLRERVTELEAGVVPESEYGELHDLYVLRRRKHNEEAALANQLAEALRMMESGVWEWGNYPPDYALAALAAYDRARNPETP